MTHNSTDALAPRKSTDRLAYRVRILPEQLDLARRRVAMLEKEAARLGLTDLLR